MSGPILDLRNFHSKNRISATEVRTVSEKTRYVEEKPETSANTEIFSWTAYEYILQKHGPYWFLITGGVATLLVILGIFTKSYFFIALVVLAFLVMVLYAKRAPAEIYFSVMPKGIGVGKKFYEFSEFKSFWVFERDGERELSLEMIKRFNPFMRLPLGEIGASKIKAVLSRFLPEAEHKELFSDQILKILRL